MITKFKTLTIADRQFQLGKLGTDVGGFILLRLIGAGISGGQLAPPEPGIITAAPTTAVKQTKVPSGEELVRTVVLMAFLRGLKFEEFQFVQRGCMQVVSWLNAPGTGATPMLVMSDAGQWAYEEVGNDLALVMRLTVEVLVWNLADFFSGGGLGSLMETAPPVTTQ